MAISAEENLKKIGISLPEPPKPVGSYLPIKRVNNLLFVSGMLPMVKGKLVREGKLGRDIGIEDGYEAAKTCCLNALSLLRRELGSLDEVKGIVKVTGYVASTSDFFDQPKVVNGASELLLEVFSERGKHARAAVGCPSLPLNSPVEIEMIAEV
jgi:enamine deaminase RidA (YjgF/YER057c/UK114 family)